MAITTYNPKRSISDIFLHNGEPVRSTLVFKCIVDNALIRMQQYDHLDNRHVEDLAFIDANTMWHKQDNYLWVREHAVEKPTFYHVYNSSKDEHLVKIFAWFTKENEVLYYLTYGKAETVVYP